MATQLPRERAIQVPFRITAQGKVSEATTSSDIWADRVRTGLLTRKTERVARMGYGTDLGDMVYEESDFATGAVEEEIRKGFDSLFPSLALESVEAEWDVEAEQLRVDVTYSLPNQDIITTSIGRVAIQGTEPPIQETL
jgi:phage baseplate assembly protein W